MAYSEKGCWRKSASSTLRAVRSRRRAELQSYANGRHSVLPPYPAPGQVHFAPSAHITASGPGKTRGTSWGEWVFHLEIGCRVPQVSKARPGAPFDLLGRMFVTMLVSGNPGEQMTSMRLRFQEVFILHSLASCARQLTVDPLESFSEAESSVKGAPSLSCIQGTIQ
jgi:hypothetical protein